MGRSSTVRGIEAIDEAAMLLRRVRFSANSPAYAEGERVAVSVDPRWSDDSESLRVLITCYGLAVQPVDWEGLRINIELKKDDHNIAWLAFLNTRGQAVREGLPAGGEYSLSLPCRVKSHIVGPLFSNPSRQIRKRGGIRWNYDSDETTNGSGRADEVVAVKEFGDEERTIGMSLLCEVRETEEGEVQVRVETGEERANPRLAINLIESRSGRVQCSGVLTLVPATTAGKWEGRLTLGKSSEVTRPYDLVFEEWTSDDTETPTQSV